MRRMGADYLCYALMNVVIDNYYPLLERLGDKLDALQDELISEPSRDALNRVLMTKRISSCCVVSCGVSEIR
ncbi:MAG: hypothetical protein U0X76_12115 [Bacteroidia bacterium]